MRYNIPELNLKLPRAWFFFIIIITLFLEVSVFPFYLEMVV